MDSRSNSYLVTHGFLKLHPWFQQHDIVSLCRAEGIIVEEYCPLARNKRAEDTTLLQVATKYGKSTAQILVRYSLQKGWVPIPKSEHSVRIATIPMFLTFSLEMKTWAGLTRSIKEETTVCSTICSRVYTIDPWKGTSLHGLPNSLGLRQSSMFYAYSYRSTPASEECLFYWQEHVLHATLR